MSGAEQADRERWTLGVRFVEGQIDRATLRTTLTYRVVPRLTLGVEYNPLASKVSPLANLLAVTETEHRPAVILGTSSDRIGTRSGQSYYGTLSKSLLPQIGLPIAPYVGAAFGTYAERWRAIGGASIAWSEELSSLVIYDGVHVHQTLTWTRGRHAVTFLLVEGYHPRASATASRSTARSAGCRASWVPDSAHPPLPASNPCNLSAGPTVV